jgi:hypothetical protein
MDTLPWEAGAEAAADAAWEKIPSPSMLATAAAASARAANLPFDDFLETATLSPL